jgi:hypothetical protein
LIALLMTSPIGRGKLVGLAGVLFTSSQFDRCRL